MSSHSAGILLWRVRDGVREVWIGHMGGPFWASRDEGAWSIPKGLLEPGEDALTGALREFAEETGLPAPDAHYVHLGEFRYASGKVVTVFAAEATFEGDLRPGTFDLEWPPHSGRVQQFPEIDRGEWCDVPTASVRLVTGQRPALAALTAAHSS